ncbi:putative RING-H2 finger protein [Ameca splendens]|uniref:RING-H2 finger protein n=1 Tax=Ameca splendens TaxID=208324 RepID=A0ABV0ZA15_9TELE
MAPADLEGYHAAFCEDSVKLFRSIKKMGGEEFCQRYQKQLKSELEEAYTNFCKHNEGKNIFYAARTPATLFVVMFFTYVLSGVTGFIGLSFLAALANLILGVALMLLCVWAYVKYSGEFREAGMLIDQVAEALWEQRTVRKVISKLLEPVRSHLAWPLSLLPSLPSGATLGLKALVPLNNNYKKSN